eukprot:scaffold10634_cov83-Attheya_sp.AAC.1
MCIPSALQQEHRLRVELGLVQAAQTFGPSGLLSMPGVSAGISMSAGKVPSPPVPKYPTRPEARYCRARSGMSKRAS